MNQKTVSGQFLLELLAAFVIPDILFSLNLFFKIGGGFNGTWDVAFSYLLTIGGKLFLCAFVLILNFYRKTKLNTNPQKEQDRLI